MKKIVITLQTVLIILLIGCQQEKLAPMMSEKSIELEAAVDDSDQSRVGFDRNGKFFWSENDQIGVILSSKPDVFTPMSLASGAGTGKGKFTCEGTGTLGEYAVYPFKTSNSSAPSHKLEGKELTYQLGTNFYNSSGNIEPDLFTAPQGYGESFRAAMFGKVTGNKVSFKHLGGVLCIKLTGLSLDDFRVQVSSDQKLSGNFTVDLTKPEPQLITTDGPSSSSYEFCNMSGQETGVFFFPVPTGTFNNVKVTLTNLNNGTSVSKNFGTITITRRMLKFLSNIKTVETTEHANQMLEEGETNIVIKGDQGASEPPVEIIPTTDNTAVNLDFTGKRTNVHIQEKAGNQAIQQVNVSLNGKQSGELKINLPHSTVNLTAKSPTQFANATVKTAASTFEVGSGVTIDVLTVKGGNVIIHNGATIKSIVKDTSEGDFECMLYVEPGANIPAAENLSGFILINRNNCVHFTNKTPVIYPIEASVEMIFASLVVPDSYGEYGICYSSTNNMPTIEDMKNQISFSNEAGSDGKYPGKDPGKDPGKGDGGSNGKVEKQTFYLTDLTPNTTYHYRAFCTIKSFFDKSETTIYSEPKTVTTSELELSTGEYVDLGLSVLWRTRNLGATNIEDVGGNYYWGAQKVSVAGDDVNVYANYVYNHETRILLPEYDAATIELKDPWRMPTNEEMSELKGCTFADYTLNGKQGCLVMGPNGKFIFLPKKHYNKEEIDGHDDPKSPNKGEWYLSYWTSQRQSNHSSQNEAYCLIDLWIKQDMGFNTYNYVYGLREHYVSWKRNALYNIRPVRNK